MGNFTFAPGFHVEVSGQGNISTVGTSTNQGIVRWTGNIFLYSGAGATFINAGLFVIETNCTWNDNILFNNLSGGILRQAGGQSSLASLTNDGTVEFQGGLLSVTNNFVSGIQSTQLWALRSYSGFGQLTAQNLGLAGTFAVTLTNGFLPTNGSLFLLASSGTRSGQFVTSTLPELPSNLTWRVQYGANAFNLKVASATTLNSPTRLPNGSFQFTLVGSEGSAYDIQASTNLLEWVTVETNSPFTGMLIYADTNASTFLRRFYRGRIFD